MKNNYSEKANFKFLGFFENTSNTLSTKLSLLLKTNARWMLNMHRQSKRSSLIVDL